MALGARSGFGLSVIFLFIPSILGNIAVRISRTICADAAETTREAPDRRRGTGQKGATAIAIIWAISGSVLVYLTTLSVPHSIQIQAAAGILLTMAVLLAVANRRSPGDLVSDQFRVIILVLGAVLTMRYVSWRIAYTVHFHDALSFAGSVALLAAEIYGILMYLLGSVVNAKPLYRPIRKPDPDDLPTVDVLIPTYNEDPEILEVTVLAATQMDYPADRFRVYLLDDGGTDAKINQPDLLAMAEASNRRSRLEALCRRTGATYMTRADNRHAKAGNINAALPRVSGQLVLLLDADHVPSTDFLQNTVGEFQADPGLFLVQTPHRFLTPDPVEKNLEVHRKMPGESEIFYRIVQHGLDAWHSSFFCGSAAILRRRHLDEIGGISGETVTEDAETSLRLHALGYSSAYVGKPMVFGLQPETFSSFIGQRSRWAQGMVQLFLLRNPLVQPGLKPSQRVGYLNSTLFWFFSYARMIFLLAPCAFLLLGLKIYDANLEQFLIYAGPHLIGALITANLLFGRARWALVSELYESVQSIFSSRAITQALMNPRAPVFNVTSKGERLEKDFVSPMVGPFYVIFLLLAAALVAGYFRYQMAPGQREVVYITAGWAMLNLFIIMGGLGALLERRQLRSAPRIYLAEPRPARLVAGNLALACHMRDISMGGAFISVDSAPPVGLDRQEGILQVALPADGREVRLPVRVVRRHGARNGVSLAFTRKSLDVKRAIVAIGYGNSDNLAWGVERDHRTPGIIGGIGIFIGLAIRQAWDHVFYLLRGVWRVLFPTGRAPRTPDPDFPVNARRSDDEPEQAQDLAIDDGFGDAARVAIRGADHS